MQTTPRAAAVAAGDLTLEQLRACLAAERAQRARLESELDLRNGALDAASTHFVILEARPRRWAMVYANRAVTESYGYALHELLGSAPGLLLRPQDNEGKYRELTAAMRDGRRATTELIARRKDGSTFWVGFYVVPINRGQGRISHYVAIGADITARREQERRQRELQDQLRSEMEERQKIEIELRLAQKLESVGRLAAGIAHEINTPIQYVGDSVSFLQAVRNDLSRLMAAYREAIRRFSNAESPEAVLPAVRQAEASMDLEFLMQETPKAFERTLDGIERVANIVRAMKEFAHPDGAEQCEADINHAIGTTLIVAHNEYKYHARIESRLAELPLVRCNIGELNQVFLNLIVNAAHAIADSGKAVPEGVITITTSVSGEEVSIAIADNGCGIPAEYREKIFDPFFTTKAVGRGTGQGLAIARSIVVDKHGGCIDVSSTVGTGACFTLRLPKAGRCSASPT
jgi:PAS domain S-box-containing protein